MNNNFLPTEKQMQKITFVAMPLSIIVVGLIGGLWWLDNDLKRGVIFLSGLTVFLIHYGLKALKYPESRKYYYWAFALPWGISVLLFSYGFLR